MGGEGGGQPRETLQRPAEKDATAQPRTPHRTSPSPHVVTAHSDSARARLRGSDGA